MRGMRIAGVAMALGMCALNGAVCQTTPDETPGQKITIQSNVGGGFNCGRVSSPLYCYGIPVSVNGAPAGTFWLDTYVSGANTGTGFVYWYSVADLAEAHITGNVPHSESVTSDGHTTNAITSLQVSFVGDTNDGDGGSYTGTMTLTFTYYYSSGGGGRGGAGAGWRFICTGGSIQITYN
jgi:hypothetical protein